MARVLVVEDNASNMTLATFLLQSADHTVLPATDAEAGLTKDPPSCTRTGKHDGAGFGSLRMTSKKPAPCARVDSNHWPHPPEGCALSS
jgi:hypothetical protein